MMFRALLAAKVAKAAKAEEIRQFPRANALLIAANPLLIR